jgi:hypothetical protein
MPESAEINLAVRHKEEIAHLFEINRLIYEQAKASEREMTPDELKQAEAREKKIKELVVEVVRLERFDTGDVQARSRQS